MSGVCFWTQQAHGGRMRSGGWLYIITDMVKVQSSGVQTPKIYMIKLPVPTRKNHEQTQERIDAYEICRGGDV